MSIYDPQDTLAYHTSRVACAYRDMSDVPVKQIAQKIKAFIATDKEKQTNPDVEAIAFYGMNHGMALLQQAYAPLEPLAPEDLAFVKLYHDKIVPMAVRAFYYLSVICVREGRHNKSWSKTTKHVAAKYGPTLGNWFEGAAGGEHGIQNSFLDYPPAAKFGDFVDAFCWAFYNSSWSGGYGGPAWGKVNDCLCRFVHGDFSAEMMLDTNWTLAHNNGPIFNKGQMYGHYSDVLYRILDVQRSGQVPEAILFDDKISTSAPVWLHSTMNWLKKRFPQDIGDYVDWYKVEALGAVKKYPSDKDAQVKKHGVPASAAEAEKLAAQKLAAAAEAEKKANAIAEAKAKQTKEEFNASHFEYMPGQYVEKIKVRTAA